MRRALGFLASLFLIGPMPASGQIPANALPLRIGADQGGGSIFRGEIAAVRLYDRALRPAELKGLAQSPRDARTTLPGCVGEWLKPRWPLVAEGRPEFPEACTIEAWVRPARGASGRIVDRITPGGADGFLLDTHPGDAIRLIVGQDQLTCRLPRPEAWTHVAAVIDGSGILTLYLDGARAAGPEHSDEDAAVVLSGEQEGPGEPLTLWYRRPARRWIEASVLGNGRLGAMDWGGVASERIDLNEDTLWSGEPYDNLNPNGLKALPQIRRLLREGNDAEAQRLVERDMNGKYNQSYQPLGDLTIASPLRGEVSHYRRELDLTRGIARVRFEHDGVRYTREVFASNPAQAIVVRYAADKPGRISFRAALGCQLHHATKAGAGALVMTGRCPAHIEPSYSGHGETWDDSPDGKGMRFEVRVVPVQEGGRVAIADEGVTAEGCDAVTLILVAATSYNGPWKSPSRDGKDPARLCDAYLAPLAGARFESLRDAHVADHRRLFGRVELDLGRSDADRPTDVRVRTYRPGADPSLAALYYQFGRYLLIASSRPGTQPANLQGIWNREIHPPWSANWTLNCNAQIDYWPVETANLGECHLPLIDLTRQLSVDGAHIARDLYGVRGWMAHHNTDIWRQAGPVSGSALWSIFQVGGAWLCQHIWEHYAFSGDTDFLREAWPTMKGAARYYLDGLMEEPSHRWLVTGPDTNFENSFLRPDGRTGCVCMGPTGSMQMVRELFRNCVEASRILGVDADLRAEIEKTLPRLPPMQVSPTTGELQEWLEDWKRTADCQVLSSWGAVCGTQITPRGTPELATALRKIYDKGGWWRRGQVGSWQGSFQANVYARLNDGDTALAVLDTHLARSVNGNLMARFPGYCDFQIDGNLGLTAAIGEMLLQSHAGEIELLPALPASWRSGRVAGLRARGGFTVDIAWKDATVTDFRITSAEPRDATVRVNGRVRLVRSEKNR